MGLWADYCIEAVRYGRTKKSITHVKVRQDRNDCLGSPETWTKEEAIIMIANRFKEVITVYRDGQNWSKGSRVQAVRVGQSYYIRTDANEIEADNLGELPEF